MCFIRFRYGYELIKLVVRYVVCLFKYRHRSLHFTYLQDKLGTNLTARNIRSIKTKIILKGIRAPSLLILKHLNCVSDKLSMPGFGTFSILLKVKVRVLSEISH